MSDSPVDRSVLLLHLDYTAWASGLLLDACTKLEKPEAVVTLRHIYYADRVWLARLEGRVQVFQDDPEPGLDDLKQVWPTLLARFREFVSGWPNELLSSELTYTNMKGEAHSVARWKVLLHVVNHGTLHRGQVMAMIRQMGHQPPATDLIYFYLRA